MKINTLGSLFLSGATILLLNACSDSSSDSSNSHSYDITSKALILDANGTSIDGAAIKSILPTSNGTIYLGTNDSSAGLVELDPADGTFSVINTADVGRSLAYSSDGTQVLVGGTFSGTLTFVNVSDNSVDRTIGALTKGTGVSPTSDGAFVFLSGTNDLFDKVDLSDDSVTTITMTGLALSYAWTMPMGKLSADETTFYMASRNFIISDLDGNASQVDIGDSGVEVFDISADDTKAYLGTSGNGVMIIDLATKTIDANVSIAHNDYFKGVQVTSDKSKLFVTENFGDTPNILYVVDLENNNTVTDVNFTSVMTRDCYSDALTLSNDERTLYLGCQSGDVIEFTLN